MTAYSMTHWWQETFPQGRQTLTIAGGEGEQIQIAYGEKGEGPLLLLVHGIGVWSYYWRHNIEALAQSHRVMAFDAKGHGFSAPFPLPRQAGHPILELGRIIQVLSDQGVDGQDEQSVAIVAESLGALTALALAQQQPQLISKLVLINVPIFPRQLPSRSMRLLASLPLDWIWGVEQLRIPKRVAPLVQQLTRLTQREVMVNASRMNATEIWGSAYPYLQFPGTLTHLAADLKLGLREIEGLLVGQPSLIQEIQMGLGAIAQPTLVLWGEQDRWFPVADGERLAQALPNSQFKVIPNCGHQAAADCPDAVNQAILSFLHPSAF